MASSRWRRRGEASLSNFLYARQIEHKRGERYPESYAKQSGRLYGRFDMHFRSSNGAWIDVEVWGDPLNRLSGGRYMVTPVLKEKLEADNPNFLGISYKDCLRDALLAKHLRPFIGDIEHPSSTGRRTDLLKHRIGLTAPTYWNPVANWPQS